MPIISGFGNAPTSRDLELRKEMALLAELEAQAKIRDLERRKADPLENAKMQASARQFETRRGVREVGNEPMMEFSPENFPPMASHAPTQPIRTIKRAAQPATPEGPAERVSTQFGEVSEPPMRTIRRFTDKGTGFTDPDAAMGARERAMLDPRVLLEQERSRGDIEAAKITASAKGKPTDASSSYETETAQRTIAAIDEVLPKIDWTTSGAVGAVAKRLPGTDAANVRAELASVASNVAFNALQAMRNASKTGGALGAVSQEELRLLTSVQGSIEQDQSPDNLIKNLKLVRESQQRFLDAAQSQGRTGDGGIPVGQRKTFPNGKVGVWDGTGWAAQ